MFSACYYLSYKSALNKFNENAVERNNDLVVTLDGKQSLQNGEQQVADNSPIGQNGQNSNTSESDITNTNVAGDSNAGIPVDTMKKETILPTTQYKLETYDLVTGNMKDDILNIPSYLVGLNRDEVIEYLHDYMLDLPWSEFEKGLQSFDLLTFSKENIVLRKIYNSELVEYKYYLKSKNGFIVVYYGDQKTIYEYTEVSVDGLTQFEQTQLEEGIFIKDLDALYSALENYSS
jgi:hypothetical protein